MVWRKNILHDLLKMGWQSLIFWYTFNINIVKESAMKIDYIEPREPIYSQGVDISGYIVGQIRSFLVAFIIMAIALGILYLVTR